MTMNEILPYEKMEYEDGQIAIDEVQITYVQAADCTESQDETQSITVSARNNGVSRFINIKTDGWSVDKPEDLTKILEDFERRASFVKDEDL